MQIMRGNDKVVEYAPPSRLRKVDVFLIDESSQIEEDTARILAKAFGELPQKYALGIAADYQQLQSVKGK